MMFLRLSKATSIQKFMVSNTTSFGAATWSSTANCTAGSKFPSITKSALLPDLHTLGSQPINTFKSVAKVSRPTMSSWYLPDQWKLSPPSTRVNPLRQAPRPDNSERNAWGKSSPITLTKCCFRTKCDTAKAM